MRVEVRETDDAVILDLHGPFVPSEEERDESRRVAREAGGRGKELVFVLHEEYLTSVELGLFIGVVQSAHSGQNRRFEWPIRLVVESERVRVVFRVTDPVFMLFDSEEEALAWKPSGGVGCLTIATLAFAMAMVALFLLWA